jgi:hypothetical protein
MYELKLRDRDLLSEAEAAKLHGQYANDADYVHGPFDQDCIVYSPQAPLGIAAQLVTTCLTTPTKTVELFRTVRGDLSNRAFGVPLMYRERPDGSYDHTKDAPPVPTRGW